MGSKLNRKTINDHIPPPHQAAEDGLVRGYGCKSLYSIKLKPHSGLVMKIVSQFIYSVNADPPPTSKQKSFVLFETSWSLREIKKT